METNINPKADKVKAVKAKGQKAKKVEVAEVNASFRTIDAKKFLARYPFMAEVFKAIPGLYRVELNHMVGNKKYSLWFNANGTISGGYPDAKA